MDIESIIRTLRSEYREDIETYKLKEIGLAMDICMIM